MGNFAENLNLGNRVRPPPGRVANSKSPLLIIAKVQLRLPLTKLAHCHCPVSNNSFGSI